MSSTARRWPPALPPAAPRPTGRLPTGPERLWCFAVEPTTAQLTWSRLGPGPTPLVLGDRRLVVEADGGPGALVADGLTPGTTTCAHLAGRRLPVATPTHPPGRELFRFATVSDLHLGERAFGYRQTMTEPVAHPDPYPVRAARAALRELAAWGAELVVVKGDVTAKSQPAEWEVFAKLVAEVGLPLEVLAGNHDTKRSHGRVGPAEGARRAGLPAPEPFRVVDVPGLRLVLVDTTLGPTHPGTLRRSTEVVADAAADARRAGRAVWVGAHHHPARLPVPTFWPPGVPSTDAGPFFAALAAANRAAFYTAGHTHRNRRYERHGVTVTEVGSPKDWPGTWAGYVVHEGGIRQVVRRVGAPDVLTWTDHSAWAAFGSWGLWSPGRLDDRCFSLTWPGRG
ncbi:MAG: metallophosphoesterase [Acidimicrobiales bacterium]